MQKYSTSTKVKFAMASTPRQNTEKMQQNMNHNEKKIQLTSTSN
jgi:hypothetical protein